MSEQDIQVGMVRAIVGGREVVGWYFLTVDGKHCIMYENAIIWRNTALYGDVPDHIEKHWFVELPDISSAAVAIGAKDMHGKMIFGSRGEMLVGDKVKLERTKGIGHVVWCAGSAGWIVSGDGFYDYMGSKFYWSELEILPKDGD